jgi:peptidoglycan-associated lipoprotein
MRVKVNCPIVFRLFEFLKGVMFMKLTHTHVNNPYFGRLIKVGVVASSCVLFALSGCSSNVKLDEPGSKIESRTGGQTLPNPLLGAQGTQNGNTTQGATSTVTTVTADDPLKDPNSPLAKRSVYFDYDSFVLKDEFRPVVEAHAKYLNTNRSRKVIVQGNTDERGSREYNLALGQKRAEVVRKSLLTLGVSDSQIEAVSLGEEKPKSPGLDEAAFAENRRADLAY